VAKKVRRRGRQLVLNNSRRPPSLPGGPRPVEGHNFSWRIKNFLQEPSLKSLAMKTIVDYRFQIPLISLGN